MTSLLSLDLPKLPPTSRTVENMREIKALQVPNTIENATVQKAPPSPTRMSVANETELLISMNRIQLVEIESLKGKIAAESQQTKHLEDRINRLQSSIQGLIVNLSQELQSNKSRATSTDVSTKSSRSPSHSKIPVPVRNSSTTHSRSSSQISHQGSRIPVPSKPKTMDSKIAFLPTLNWFSSDDEFMTQSVFSRFQYFSQVGEPFDELRLQPAAVFHGLKRQKEDSTSPTNPFKALKAKETTSAHPLTQEDYVLEDFCDSEFGSAEFFDVYIPSASTQKEVTIADIDDSEFGSTDFFDVHVPSPVPAKNQVNQALQMATFQKPAHIPLQISYSSMLKKNLPSDGRSIPQEPLPYAHLQSRPASGRKQKKRGGKRN